MVKHLPSLYWVQATVSSVEGSDENIQGGEPCDALCTFFFTRWEHIRKHLPSLQPCKMKLIKDMSVGEVKNELPRKLSGNITNYFPVYAHLTK